MGNVTKANVGKPVKTHDKIQSLVITRKWIVYKSGPYINAYTAAAFVNRRYIDVCKMLKDKVLYEYVKNK